MIKIIFGIIIIFLISLYFCFNDKSKQSDNKSQPSEYTPQRTLTYKDMLLLPEWKSKRYYILNRDNYKCQRCGKNENLQVHHKYYSKYPNNVKVQPWNYPNDALITLCDECHKKVHKKKIKVYYRKYTDNY